MGQRLRAAAVEAGLSAAEIAAQLAVTSLTVYRWRWGQRAPAPPKLQAYAAFVGKPVAFFYAAEPEPPPRPRELSDLLLTWANLLMAGERSPAAFDRAVGDRRQLTPPERRRLTAVAARMREDLTRAAGGDWEFLTEEERREILEQIARLAERRRAAPREPTS